MLQEILKDLPHTNEQTHSWCLAAGFIFVAISFIVHLVRGKFTSWGIGVALRQFVGGLSFPYSLLLIFTIVDDSIMHRISDLSKYLTIAGFATAAIAVAAVFRV